MKSIHVSALKKKKKRKSRRSGGACQGWKIWLTKEECKFEKTRMEFSLLTGAQKTDVSSWFQTKMIVLSFSAMMSVDNQLYNII